MSLARVYIANSIPRYFTEGAWDELDWLEIGGVVSLGAVGRAPKSASFRPVDAPAMMHYETAPAQHELVIECQDQRGPVNDRLNASVLSRQEKAFRIVYEAADGCHGPEGAEVIEHLIGPVIAYRSGAAEVETAAKRMIRVAINGVFNAVQPPLPPPEPTIPQGLVIYTPSFTQMIAIGASDPLNLELLVDSDMGASLDFPWSIVGDFQRKVLFVFDYGLEKIVSIDVTDNNGYTVLQSYGEAGDFSASWFMQIDLARNLLFASDWNWNTTGSGAKTLYALDVSDPANIVEVGALYGVGMMRGGMHLDAANNILITAVQGERFDESQNLDEDYGGITIYDVSDPSSIVELGHYGEFGVREALNLAYDSARDVVFLIDEKFNEKIIVIDVSNLAAPAKISEQALGLDGEAFGVALDMETNVLYVSLASDSLVSFDVSVLTNITELDRVSLAYSFDSASMHFDATNKRIFATNLAEVQVYDVSTPSAMTLVESYEQPGAYFGGLAVGISDIRAVSP